MRASKDQEGQSLITILVLGAVIAFLGFAMVSMLRYEMGLVAKTKFKDASFSGGDSALQRAVDVLGDAANGFGPNLLPLNWENGDQLSGFASLTSTGLTPTGVGYRDAANTEYFIKILKGDRYPPTGTFTAATDVEVVTWPNRGDTIYDRTIIVRTVNLITNKEDRFFTVVHRTAPPPYQYGGDAIITGGMMDLGGQLDAGVINTCLTPVTQPASEGSLVAGSTIVNPSSTFQQFDNNPNSTTNLPPLVIPSGTLLVPGEVTRTATLNNSVTLGPVTPSSTAGWDYEIGAIDYNNDTMLVNISGGPIRLWVKNYVTIGGSSQVTTTGTFPGCCQAKGFTMYVVSSDTYGPCQSNCGNATNGTGARVQWNGTPTGTWMLVMPLASFCQSGGGSGTFKGAVAAKNFCVNAGGSAWFIYDKCLATKPPANNYTKPPVVTSTWKQLLITR